MTDELKPCPFCGGEAEIMRTDNGGHIVCLYHNCNAVSPTFYKSESKAIDAWNTRAERTCRAELYDNLQETDGNGDAWANCSECGALLCVLTSEQEWPNYCPNCGAKVVD